MYAYNIVKMPRYICTMLVWCWIPPNCVDNGSEIEFEFCNNIDSLDHSNSLKLDISQFVPTIIKHILN
jgi:hypothetical protein